MPRFTRLLIQCLLIATNLAIPAPGSARALPQLGLGKIFARQYLSSSGPSTSINVGGATPATATVSPAPELPNTVAWSPIIGNTNNDYQPIRGSLGGNIFGPINAEIASQNPDTLAPPTTDHGVVCVLLDFTSLAISISCCSPGYSPNAKWPFSLSRNRLQTGGWARQQNSAFSNNIV